MKLRIGCFSISNEPDVRRFGLEQAEAAKKLTKDPSDVMAVVVHVLGYQNTVAEEVVAANDAAQARIEANRAAKAAAEAEINQLRQTIYATEKAVENSAARQVELAEIAKQFAGK